MKLADLVAAYFAAFDGGRLPYLACSSCDHIFYYPRSRCPKCGSGELKVSMSSGQGTVFSYTRLHPKEGTGKVYGIFQLEEGFRMYSNMEGQATPNVGQRVRVTFRELNGKKYPFFEPS